MSEQKDFPSSAGDDHYVEAHSKSLSPPKETGTVTGEGSTHDTFSEHSSGHSHQRDDSLVDEPPLEEFQQVTLSERSARVGYLITQAAQLARQEEAAQATARSKAQIAAQKRKMRGRGKRIAHAEEVPEAQPYQLELENTRTSGQVDNTSHLPGGNNYGSDGKSYNLPTPPAFALLDIGNPGQKPGVTSWVKGPLGYKIVLWLGLIFMSLVIITCLSLLVLFLVIHPKPAEYNLDEIRVQKWWITPAKLNSSAMVLNADADFIIKASNPNTGYAVVYPNTTLSVFFDDSILGSVQVPPATILPSQSNYVVANWICISCPIASDGSQLTAETASGSVPLSVKLFVTAAAQINGVNSPSYSFETDYQVSITPPKTIMNKPTTTG